MQHILVVEQLAVTHLELGVEENAWDYPVCITGTYAEGCGTDDALTLGQLGRLNSCLQVDSPAVLPVVGCRDGGIQSLVRRQFFSV